MLPQGVVIISSEKQREYYFRDSEKERDLSRANQINDRTKAQS